jgi:peptidoglycan/xylan/chitin deacetylase (PgdA/CDA1 family)/energy-converting hydrogenase Eha subunit A
LLSLAVAIALLFVAALVSSLASAAALHLDALPPPEPRRSDPTATPAVATPLTSTVAANATVTAAPTAALPAGARVPILMYHYVSSPAPTAERLRRDLSVEPLEFERQMRWLKDNGFTTISLGQLHDHLSTGAPLPPKPVVLTFDDGHIEHYATVYPLLKSLGMTGTFFIVADYATFSYTNPTYLSWQQAREMADGGMSIESHGRSHRDLRNRSFQFLVWEVLGSIEQIEAYTGQRPRFFCYPVGHYDDAIIRMLKSVDMRAAVTTEHGAEHRLSNGYTWRRLRVRYTTSMLQFAALVGGQ